jgi:hypothetical protein
MNELDLMTGKLGRVGSGYHTEGKGRKGFLRSLGGYQSAPTYIHLGVIGNVECLK